MTPPPPVASIATGNLHPDPQNRPDGSGDEGLAGMAATIRVLGVMVPLTVKPYPGRRGHYLIVDGHCRWRAAMIAGLGEVPCQMRRLTRAEQAAGPALAQIVMNTHRAALGPVEMALALSRLLTEGTTPGGAAMTQADIARYTGLSDATISYHLELLHLDDATLGKVRDGTVPAGAAHEHVRQARAAGLLAPAAGPAPVPARRGRPAGRNRKPPPPWFTVTHDLADAAADRCRGQGHEAWTRIGKVACGPCWQHVIEGHAVAAAAERARESGDAARLLGLAGLTPADLTAAARAALFSGTLPPPAVMFSAGQAS